VRALDRVPDFQSAARFQRREDSVIRFTASAAVMIGIR
jgi:hypothetical protein